MCYAFPVLCCFLLLANNFLRPSNFGDDSVTTMKTQSLTTTKRNIFLPSIKSNPRNASKVAFFNGKKYVSKSLDDKSTWCRNVTAIPLSQRANVPRTALASFPGSGSTWLRYLIQQTTGFLTGSVYRDYSLQRTGFLAEFVNDSSVIGVKTHEFDYEHIAIFDRAILLVRKPKNAFLSEFNRRYGGGHTGLADQSFFLGAKSRKWKTFITNQLPNWGKLVFLN